MIRLDSISKQYTERPLFENLDWAVTPGARIGLVGPNGAGKTTLFRILAGEEVVDSGRIEKPKDYTIGYLPQEATGLAGAEAAIGRGTVLEAALGAFADILHMEDEMRSIEEVLSGPAGGDEEGSAEGLEHQRLVARYGMLQGQFETMGGFTVEARARKVLLGLGVPIEDLDKPMVQLSGGFRMRVLLARLLLATPDLLLLDEPTNHLDLQAIDWLESYLEAYQGTLVMIAHDRFFLNRLVTEVAELRDGRLRQYPGNYEQYLKRAAEEEERQQSMVAGLEKKIEATERFVNRFKAKATKASQAQSRQKVLDKLQDQLEKVSGGGAGGGWSGGLGAAQSKSAMGLKLVSTSRCGKEAITLNGASKAYSDKVVYSNLDFSVARGDKLALVGVNGAGKSTLLRMLAGTLTLDQGERCLGANVKVSYFAQHALEVLNPQNTVLEEAQRHASLEAVPKVRRILGAFGFHGAEVEKKVSVLSGGEKGRLALALLLISPGNVLLLDEPTNHLDMASREVLEEALANYDGTMVLVSHDRYFINKVVNCVVEVAPGGGVVRYPGNYDDYLHMKALSGGDGSGLTLVSAAGGQQMSGRASADDSARTGAGELGAASSAEVRLGDKERKRR